MYKVLDILKNVEDHSGEAFFYTPPKYSNALSLWFRNPKESVIINSKEEITSGLEKINKLLSEGLIGYSLIAYEFGYLLEEKLEDLLLEEYDFDLLKFVFFERADVDQLRFNDLDFTGVPERLLKPDYFIEDFELNTDKAKYISDINSVKHYISKGDTYQVNYTVKGKFKFSGVYSDLFLNLIFNQSAEFCTFINNDSEFVISVSPELFFRNKGLSIETRPMKGTIKRGANITKDAENQKWLKNSEKNQAENVMIVDLLRNDLGRISKFNSVYVKSLFDIEQYESLLQMTSTICSELKEDDLGKILAQIFPCGSITGAPKIRTMEIIKELENEPRGIYTGSIGIVSKNENTFNVAIRTVRIKKESQNGEIGIGSGVVWDSEAESEYEETLLKGSFLTSPQKYFELFETILNENESYFLMDYHLDRMEKASEYFLFTFNREKAIKILENTVKELNKNKKYKVKFLLNKWGEFRVEYSEITDSDFSGKVFISSIKTDPENKFLNFKTTKRELYSEELNKYKKLGFDEVLFVNNFDELTEGSYTNIFVENKFNMFTPSIESGLLDGCLRRQLLIFKDCEERILKINDLTEADNVFIGNSVRGLIKVKEIWTERGLLVNFSC